MIGANGVPMTNGSKDVLEGHAHSRAEDSSQRQSSLHAHSRAEDSSQTVEPSRPRGRAIQHTSREQVAEGVVGRWVPHSCSHFNSGRYCLNNALQDMAVGEGLPRSAQAGLSSVAHSVAEQNRLPHSAVGRAL